MSECEEVGQEWAELGATLRMTQSDLDNIEHSHGEDPDRCRRELFKVKYPSIVAWCMVSYCLSKTLFYVTLLIFPFLNTL